MWDVRECEYGLLIQSLRVAHRRLSTSLTTRDTCLLPIAASPLTDDDDDRLPRSPSSIASSSTSARGKGRELSVSPVPIGDHPVITSFVMRDGTMKDGQMASPAASMMELTNGIENR
jgi:hypothetical protein